MDTQMCDACDNKPPYMCQSCNQTADDDAPIVFEPHDGRMSVVGNVGPDFWFV